MESFEIFADVWLLMVSEKLSIIAVENCRSGMKFCQLFYRNFQVLHVQTSAAVGFGKFTARNFLKQQVFWLRALVNDANRSEMFLFVNFGITIKRHTFHTDLRYHQLIAIIPRFSALRLDGKTVLAWMGYTFPCSLPCMHCDIQSLKSHSVICKNKLKSHSSLK